MNQYIWMGTGTLLNKALTPALRSCFTRKLKLCESIGGSSLWPQPCRAHGHRLLSSPLLFKHTCPACPTDCVFFLSLHSLTPTSEVPLLVYPFPQTKKPPRIFVPWFSLPFEKCTSCAALHCKLILHNSITRTHTRGSKINPN